MTTRKPTDCLQRVNKLIAQIKGELNQRQAPKTVLEQMQRSALTGLCTELEMLAQLLAINQYRLVFIGQVEVGKTTAICHLIGLTADRDKKKKLSKTGPEKVFHVTEDLMATGAGFTTLCEVVIMPANGNRFVIEPYGRQEVERTIADFCQVVWKRVYPDSEDSGQQAGGGSEQVNFPPELVRAVRNMVKLPERERRDDAAIRLAQEFADQGFEQFRSRVLSQANLDARTQTEFVCQGDEPDPRKWIKDRCR